MRKKKNSILIVDDEKQNIITLTKMLNEDYKVYAVRDSRETLETVEEDLPDLIILDADMPEMDGYEVITALKNSEKAKNIPIVLCVAVENIEDTAMGISLGVTDYIVKPYIGSLTKLRVDSYIQLTEKRKQQELITRVAYQLQATAPLDTLLTNAFRTIGVYMGIGKIMLYSYSGADEKLTCKNEWINPGLRISSQIGTYFEMPESLVSVMHSLLAEEGRYYVHSNDPAFKDVMKPYRKQFQSYISTPIIVEGKLYAILDFSRLEKGWDWSWDELSLASLFTSVVSHTFERKHIEQELNTAIKQKNGFIAAKEHSDRMNAARMSTLTSMSHEMRTPMNAIMNMMQISKMHGMPENIRYNMDKIYSAFLSTLQVMDEVLDLVGRRGKSIELEDSSFDFKKMVNGVLQDIGYISDEKNLEIESNIEQDIPSVLTGDALLLEQVILNLLLNAVRYTPLSGKVSLDARIVAESTDSVTLQVEVSDNGVGIPKEQMQSLFEYYREDEEVGIGLVLAKRIIKLMNGDIQAESVPDKGTKFVFTCQLKKWGVRY